MILVESPFRFSFLFEHDLFGKPVSTFPDHAIAFVVLRIKVAISPKRTTGKATLLYKIAIIAMNTPIAL
jgi:hypothetical protein